ncbi:MAG: AAA family ATPase, partial [Phycisphaerales bacterium]|nr:AAA family ATPase [Phycisphaerales bacterium]
RIQAAEDQKDAKIKELTRRNLEARARQYAEDTEKYKYLVDELENLLEKNQTVLKDLAAEQSKYEALKNRREHLEQQRTEDLKLITEIQLMRVRDDARRVRLFNRAMEPRQKSFPKVQVIVPLGVLSMVGIMVGVVFLRELMDQRVKSASDLAVLPGANLLGGIPDLMDEPTKIQTAELAVRRHPLSVLAESYRQAAATIQPLIDRNGHQTVLFVGGLPASGTTTVVTNMAAAMAAAGRKVLMIDANFRRPRLAEAMGVPDNAGDGLGLGDLLGGAATIDQVIIDAGQDTSLIGAGTPASRVFDRLNNGAFDSALAELRGRFDLILIDSPPAVVAGDAFVLANKVDAAVLVVRAHQEHRGLVARMIHRFADARCDLLGVLLNRPRGTAGGYLKKNYATMAEYTAKLSS